MPNSAHLHLILNHFPVIGLMMVVLVLIYAVIINNDKIKKLGMFLLVLIGLITISVFMTGGKAASIVKGNDGITEENIEPHEDFAKTSMIAMEVTAGISLIALVLFRKEKAVPVWFGIVLLVLIIGVNLMMVYTGHLGGRISHDVIMKHF